MTNIIELLEGVVFHLPGWGLPVEEHPRSFKLPGPNSMQLRVYAPPGADSRLTVVPIWPVYFGIAITPFDTGELPRTERSIRASFSTAKARSVIAKDIKRRVIDPYARFLPGCLDRLERKKNEQDILVRHGQRIADTLGVDLKLSPGEVFMKIHSECYGSIGVLSGSTMNCCIDIRGISVNKALKIAEILAD